MTIHTASSSSELLSKLDIALGGDTIRLLPGAYTSIDIEDYAFSDYVTIISADLNDRAVFSSRVKIRPKNAVNSFIRLQSVRIHNPGTTSWALQVHTCDHIETIDCDITGGNHCAQFFVVDHLKVSGNRFDTPISDTMKFGGITNFEISDNIGSPSINPESNDHVDFIQIQGSSSNGWIRGNVILPVSMPINKTYQGIFIHGNAVHTNLLIEQNLVNTNSVHGITVGGDGSQANDITIRNNTVLGWPQSANTTLIQIRNPRSNPVIEANNVSQNGPGIVANKTNPSDPFHYSKLYEDVMGGLGTTIEGFRPIPGGPADFGSGMGAEIRIAELLNGGTMPETFTYALESDATNGTTVVNADGTWTYDPNTDYVGADSWSYRKNSSLGGTGVGNMSGTVTAPAVTAPDGSFTTEANTQASGDLKTL